MARIEDIERRLLNWARWRAGMMRGGLGYATASMEPRVDGEGYDAQAIIPTIDVEASETDRAVTALDTDLKRTLEVCYLDGGGIKRHAARLGISESSIKERIDRAHKKLQRWFADKAAAARQNRERVEALLRSARPG